MQLEPGVRGPVYHIVSILLVLTCGFNAAAQVKNTKELVKVADKYFEAKNYKDALPLYSQLVSNYPKDPNYNYRYGASLLFADVDKSKALPYLEFAVGRTEVEPEAFFFLGKAYHLNYSFSKASKNYEKFRDLGKAKEVARYDVASHLRQAKSGKTLLRNLTDIIVLQKQKLQDADFFKVYDLTEFGGKIVVKPEEFMTSYEKESGIPSILYLPKNASRIYFSSIDSEDGNKDLYYADKTAKGWSSKKKLPAIINTEFDEDYAFVHPDANVLYFSSKGHNSLGGYDIFKSELDPNTGTWSKPVNMDFAINTPDDDFLFITDKEQKLAYFTSKRSSVQGQVHVYRINMKRVPLNIAVISGIFESNTTKKATIQVKDKDRGVLVGEYDTDPKTGKYLIELPQTGNYQFLVDYEGSEVAHAGDVSLKDQNPLKPLLQEMKIEDQGTVDEKLIIRNLIDVQVEDDDPIIAEIFKQRAQLNVTPEDKAEEMKKEIPTGPTVSVSEKSKAEEEQAKEEADGQVAEAKAEESQTKTDEGSKEAPDPKFELIGDDFTKEDIVNVSRNNAQSLEKDAKILEEEANIASKIAQNKRAKAKVKRDEVKLTMSKIDTSEKTTANAEELARIEYIQRQAEDLEDEARVSDELAEDLKDRAYQKKSGMAIAMSYANQIQNSIDQNNKENSLEKLKQLQDYVEEQKQEKSSINSMSETIDAKLEQKRAILRNQKRYQKRLEDQLFTKETRYMEMDPDPENPGEAASQLAEELKRDRINVERVKSRTVRTQREVETLRSELQVIKEIADDVNSSEEIAQLANETPDNQVVPVKIEVPDITEDLKEASETELEESEGQGEGEGEANEAETSTEDEDGQAQRPQSLNSLVDDQHTDYEKPSGGRFHPETINKQLEKPEDQSLAIIMRSSYNNAYQEDFLLVAEEQNDMVRMAKMKVLNEDWIADIQDEYDYIDSLERTNTMPEKTEAIEERKSSLRKLLNVKKQQLSNVDKQLTELAVESAQDPELMVQQIREGKQEELAQYQATAEAEAEAVERAKEEAAKQASSEEAASESGDGSTEEIAENAEEQNESQINEGEAGNEEEPTPDSNLAVNENTTEETVGESGTEEDANAETATQNLNNVDSEVDNAEVETANQDEASPGEEDSGNIIEEAQSSNETGTEAPSAEESSSNEETNASANNTGQLSTEEADSNEETNTSADNAEGISTEQSGTSNRQAKAQVTKPEEVEELVLNGDEESIVERVNPRERFISSEATGAAIENKISPVKTISKERLTAKRRQIADVEDEITSLESQIAATKRKKKKRPLEADLKHKQQELVILQAQVENIKKEADAVVNLSAMDVYDNSNETRLSPKELGSINLQELEQMALDTAAYAESLRSLAENTKKKKEKARLLKQAEVYDERTKLLEAEIENSKKFIEELDAVETQVASLKENQVIELPKASASLDSNQVADIQKSPEFIKYDTETKAAERKIKRAEVLYQQALKLELESNMKEAEAEELEAQVQSIEKPEEKELAVKRAKSLRKSVDSLRSSSSSMKKEAHDAAVEGNKQRNSASATVLQLDPSQRDAIAALVAGKTKTDSPSSLEGKTSFTPEEFSDIVEGKAEIPTVLTTAIYKKVEFNESLYNKANPIPVNSKVPQGLVYMVQVGAFRNPISQDVFKGFAPVRGESAPGGLTRYMAGLFKKINAANLTKNEIRAIGYSDAFVVAYFNGERITLSQARSYEGAGPALANEGQIGSASSPSASGAEMNVIQSPSQVFKADEIDGLYFTVQVGAFSREVPPSTLFNLLPLVSRQVSGLVKYTCGIYSDRAEATVAKDKIRQIGIKDAFVTTFYNGKQVTGQEAQNIIEEKGDDAFADDVPVRTGNSGNTGGATGVKYQVQVGAYAEEVPVEDARIILGLSNLGLDVKSDGGMTKYVVGGYTSYKEANDFKQKVIGQGMRSAFIVAYKDGQKIDIQTAKQLTGD